MKRSMAIIIFSIFVLNACGPSQEQIQATVQVSIAETQNAIPTPTNTSVPTNTPEPTSTPEPSPTPIALPDTLSQTFSGISVTHRDDFEYIMDNLLPYGWSTSEKYSVWVTKDNQLKIQPKGDGNPWSGTYFAYLDQKIVHNTGIFFTFKYSGNSEAFTLGIDNENPSGILGERWEKFHSVAMEIREGNLIVYS